MSKFIIGEMPLVGKVPIDIDAVIKDWSHLWSISGYLDPYDEMGYTLAKAWSIRSREAVRLKVSISETDANALISRLGLKPRQNPIFKRAYTYRRPKDTEYIKAYFEKEGKP